VGAGVMAFAARRAGEGEDAGVHAFVLSVMRGSAKAPTASACSMRHWLMGAGRCLG
jgi:hypothetical protein